MKKLYLHILLFLIPLLVFVAALQIDERARFIGLKDDCFNHGIWIFDRIFHKEKEIDLLFLGSSHTINGINDELLEKELKSKELDVVNMGYCRLGRNFHYALLKKVLQKKAPQYLVLEVRGDENRYSHPIFPYIACSRDVLMPNPFFNRDILSDIWTHLAYKLELSQQALYDHKGEIPYRLEEFGFASSRDTASFDFLEEVAAKRMLPKKEMSKFERDFHMQFPRFYIEKISRICKEEGIVLYFLFLPEFGTYLEKPREFEFYQQFGKVLLPPQKILDEKAYWHDENHLNQAGAQELNLWLARYIEKW